MRAVLTSQLIDWSCTSLTVVINQRSIEVKYIFGSEFIQNWFISEYLPLQTVQRNSNYSLFMVTRKH